MASAKPPQILQLTPASEIVFEGPFTDVVTSYLELKNPSEQKVCFKVKTTAPRRYCVRPNSGIVEPGKKVKIAIMLQPIEQDNQSERSKHKFMVQSTIIQDENCNLETVWQNAGPDNVMDSKLRCIFQASSSTSSSSTEQQQKATTTATATTTAASVAPIFPEFDTEPPRPVVSQVAKGAPVVGVASGVMAATLDSSTTRASSSSGIRVKSYAAASPAATTAAAKAAATAVAATMTTATKATTQKHLAQEYIMFSLLLMFFVGILVGKYII